MVFGRDRHRQHVIRGNNAIKENQKLREDVKRMTAIVSIYTKYRQWMEEQASSSYGMVKFNEYRPSQIYGAINDRDVMFLGTGRYGYVHQCIIGQMHVAVKTPNERPLPSKREFYQELYIFRPVRATVQFSILRIAPKMQLAILKTIRHPNLVTLVGACPETQVLVHEFLPNGSLEDRFTGRVKFTWEERVRAASSICSALVFLHRTKSDPIVHGNLHPRNILFGAHNECKLSDFSMSHLLQHASKPVSVWDGVVELARLFIDSDTHKIQLDVSALGIILLQLVTARPADDLRKYVHSRLGDARRFQAKSMEQQREVLRKIVDPNLKKCPFEDAAQMLLLGLRCSDPEEQYRPEIAADVWPHIESMKSSSSYSQD